MLPQHLTLDTGQICRTAILSDFIMFEIRFKVTEIRLLEVNITIRSVRIILSIIPVHFAYIYM